MERQRLLWGLTALCILVICTVSLIFPGARFSFLIPAAFISGFLIFYTYNICPFKTPGGTAILISGYTLVVCGIIININYFTFGSGGTFYCPVLENVDSLTDWSRAMNRLDGDTLPDRPIMGTRYYSYVIQWMSFIFGRDIGCPLMFNALCYSLTIILFGAITYRLTKDKTISTITMGIGTLMCYLMVQATVLIKDVPLTMCVAGCVYIMVKWRENNHSAIWEIILFIVSAIGISFLRANFLLMLLLGTIILGIRHNGIDMRFIWIAGCEFLLFVIMHTFFHFPSVATNVDIHYGTGVFVHNQNVAAWDNMLSQDYEVMSVWKRIVWLPASIIVQFLIPFPWNFSRDMIFGPTEAVAHFGYFWYYAGAILIYWLFDAQKNSPITMRLSVLWGILLTVATAYMTSGRVSRYCLPYLPMLLPAVGYTLYYYKSRKSFRIWICVFTVLLIPVLIICHHLQTTA